MLHYVHQLVTDFVLLLCGAGEQWVYQTFFSESSCMLLQSSFGRVVRVNPGSKAEDHKAETLSRARRNCRVGDNSHTVHTDIGSKLNIKKLLVQL